MTYHKSDNVYVVSIARGEDIHSSLLALVGKENIQTAALSGIGAAQDVELGYYNVAEQEYSTKVFEGEYEIAAMTGNISRMDGKPYLHIHITLGDKEFGSHSGHLVRATVSGACEIVVHAIPDAVERVKDDVTGLNLFTL